MAEFPGLTVTNAGLAMISESLSSSTALIFTAIKMGDGTLATGTNIKTLTAMINPLLTTTITSHTDKGDGTVIIRFTVSNSTLSEGFFARELGVYAKVGENGTEQLYGYANAGNLCDYVPDKNTPIDDQIIDLYVVIGNATNVVITMSSASAVTVYDLKDHNDSTSAHANLMSSHNTDATAHSALLRTVQRSHTYAVGDIAYSNHLPSWARLECVTAGTTGATEPAGFANVSTVGVLLSDGSIIWIVDDIRDATPVGAVTGRLYLPAGYVKCNGATVQRADYPRLVALADKYSLWTSDTAANLGMFGAGDGSTTMALPNWSGRMAQFAATSGGTVAAGLPNITSTKGPYVGGATGQFGAVIIGNSTGYGFANNGGGDFKYVTFDASQANAIYGASATVQPPAVNVLAVMRY